MNLSARYDARSTVAPWWVGVTDRRDGALGLASPEFEVAGETGRGDVRCQ